MVEGKEDIIFIGDFNYDVYNENTSYEKFLNNHNLKRALLPGLTSTNFNTQIDIIFVSDRMNNYVTGIYESIFSDHKPIFIGLSNGKNSEIKLCNNPEEYSKASDSITINTFNNQYALGDLNNKMSNINKTNDPKCIQNQIIIDAITLHEIDKSLNNEILRSEIDKKKIIFIQRNVLTTNSWLGDESINVFLNVIRYNYPMFNTIDTLLINSLQWVEPTTNEDIQIVHSDLYRHWHCIYYDAEKLYIYDSLFCHKHTYENLDEKEKLFISIRYPSLKQNNIIFEKIQQQLDQSSCGIFAAAFAVTKIFKKYPSLTSYSQNMQIMRLHFMKIIIGNIINELPQS